METTLAQRLELAFNVQKEKDPTISKAGLARSCGIKSPSVMDWFAGRTKALEYSNAVKAAKYLNVSAQWLATGKGQMSTTSIDTEDDEAINMAGLIAIPQYDACFAAGDGYEPTYEEVNDSVTVYYREEWFNQRGINPHDCKRFKVDGTSMEPMIWDGDSILVDCSPQRIIAGKIYAFGIRGELRIKILFPRIDGSMLVRSINPEVPDEIIPTCDMSAFRLIGRVRDRSGSDMF